MPTRTPERPADARDGVFRALADSTRREVVERLGRGPASVSDLAGGFDMALPSFVEHLRVLEASGLVRSEKRGRVRTYALSPEGLRPLEEWLAAQRRLWERRLDQFDEYVRQLHVAEQQQATGGEPSDGRRGGSR